jgi:hypothetical protein
MPVGLSWALRGRVGDETMDKKNKSAQTCRCVQTEDLVKIGTSQSKQLETPGYHCGSTRVAGTKVQLSAASAEAHHMI